MTNQPAISNASPSILHPPSSLRTPGRKVFPNWRRSLRDAVKDVDELLGMLKLERSQVQLSPARAREFPLLVPREFVSRMRKGDPHDPLLRQVLPVVEENHDAVGFVHDPVGDAAAEVAPGLLHKYVGRVLLVSTGICAVHCRYCFRRHFPYSELPRSNEVWQPALDAIEADISIHEVILSGGDPLTLSDNRLAQLTDRIAAIGHVRRLRVHSRLPVVIPSRITDKLLDWLTGTRLTPWMVVHINHAQEIDQPVESAIARLADHGVPVLNQTVLLAGVNDSFDAQQQLCERLIDIRVQPYYLHRLDRVSGAAHFDVPAEKGRKITAALQSALPGYAVPRFVEEIAGKASKSQVI